MIYRPFTHKRTRSYRGRSISFTCCLSGSEFPYLASAVQTYMPAGKSASSSISICAPALTAVVRCRTIRPAASTRRKENSPAAGILKRRTVFPLSRCVQTAKGCEAGPAAMPSGSVTAL